MLSDANMVFTKDNLDTYLKELAKEFRKLNGKAMPAELILIGGAAILTSYGFRETTTDIDAVIHAASSMKDAINRVGDRYGLPNGWLNADFVRTDSYSARLPEVSVPYKTFSDVLSIRTISAEYLIAMKLRSGRRYKNDFSDILGILVEHEKRDLPITFEAVEHAIQKLYGGWGKVPPDAKGFIQDAMRNGNYAEVYASVHEEEKQSKNILIQFEKDYPNTLADSNANDILKTLKARKQEARKESVAAQLKKPADTPVPAEKKQVRKKSRDMER